MDATTKEVKKVGVDEAGGLASYDGLTDGTLPNLAISGNTTGSKTRFIGQQMGVNDFWRIYGTHSVTDNGEMVFEVGDNGAPFAGNGERFRFSYDASVDGTAKDVLIVDYDRITTPNMISIIGDLGSSGGSGMRINNTNTNGFSELVMDNDAPTSDGGFVFGYGGTGTGVANTAYFFQRRNAPMLFGTNNTERARITGDGQLQVSSAPTTPTSVVRLGDLGITNSTTVALTQSDLNTAYPTAIDNAFTVYCPSIVGGGFAYHKITGGWTSTALITVP